MKPILKIHSTLLVFFCSHALAAEKPSARKAKVPIVGDSLHLNGTPIQAGREWRGHKIEGLLMNARTLGDRVDSTSTTRSSTVP